MATKTAEFTLHPLPPHDFPLSLSIFSSHDDPNIGFDNGKFWQIIDLGGKLALATVESTGTPDKPVLNATIESDTALYACDNRVANAILTHTLNLNLDLKPFYEIAGTDPVLKIIIKKLFGLKNPVTPTPFQAIVESIIQQQISLTAAFSMQRRLLNTFGQALELNDKTYRAFPTPEVLASGTPEQFRACGLSGAKARYIQNIATEIKNGELDLDAIGKKRTGLEMVAALDEIKGIGPWTAELSVIRSYNRYDVIPADDIGLRATFGKYFAAVDRISSERVREIAAGWGDWKGLAAFYIIVAERLKIEV